MALADLRMSPAVNADLAERLELALTPIFGRMPNLVSDSPGLTDWLRSAGCRAFTYEEIKRRDVTPEQRKNIVAAFTDSDAVPPYWEWHELFSESRVLVLPLLSFDPRLYVAAYTVARIARSAFRAAVKLNVG